MLFLTFLSLVAGLLYTAKSNDDPTNKINKFMRYRVTLQFFAIVILLIAMLAKDQIIG